MSFGVLIRSTGVSLKDLFLITISKLAILLPDVTILSPNTYFNFTPLLASTAVGTLEFRCAIEPVSGAFSNNRPTFTHNRFVGTLLKW